ncbi:MAG TPA: FMN-binding glutamate synthase family protein [Gammaproteobacteria bacterium]|nr:FMN-binding glutamate synthase family protein [Gammaproteobacteria bacterium]
MLGRISLVIYALIWSAVLYRLFSVQSVFFWPWFSLVVLLLVAVRDVIQTRYNVLRMYPIVGHLRYIALELRPMIRRYFVESNLDGVPFNRENREYVEALANDQEDVLPFGTQLDVTKERFETIKHSLSPCVITESESRHLVGGKDCSQPYLASRLNISAMSYGALGHTAISALNQGARLAKCAHNTGEGGLSSYHLSGGGDLIFQFGTGLFGVRTSEGVFSPEKFQEVVAHPAVKMVEVKLSQGAKPGHGGLLPGHKVSKEISEIRGIPMGKDCLSPPTHNSFSTPIELLEFIQSLRELSGGMPVGFKLCLGLRKEFVSIVKAMLSTKITPDFITIDGAEGGTGAAPMTYSNHVGTPIEESLIFVHNSLVGVGLRDSMSLIASGKVITPFDMISKLALGADMCNSARGMMFSLGCIQSLRCHLNSCPTGVATTNKLRAGVLDVNAKAKQVAHYHNNFMKHVLELTGAAGIQHVDDLGPMHVQRRLQSGKIKTYQDIFTLLEPNQLIDGRAPEGYQAFWDKANESEF